MKDYSPDKIRNLALIGHGGTGKTTLAEAALFKSGAVNRLGKVEEGTTVSDWDPEEQKRNFSISLSVLPLEHDGHKLNLLDAPGYPDFVGEVKSALAAADAALIVVCVASGVQVGTEMAFQYAGESSRSRAFFINRMDRENADFNATLGQLQARFGQKCVAVQMPIGSQHDFSGIVDLIRMKAYVGDDGKEQEVPADLSSQAATLREKLVEAAAEIDEELIAKYLEGEELSEEELLRGLRGGIRAGSVAPVFTGSAGKLIGVAQLIDTVAQLFPAPGDLSIEAEQGGEVKAEAAGPLAALVFKTTADPYVGKLSYFRVFSGALKSDSQVWDSTQQKAERVGQVYHIRGKTQENAAQVSAGDIGAVAKLADTLTGDTLCQKESAVVLPGVSFPEPAFSAAVFPKSKADLDKMGTSLQRMVEEDPSLHLERHPVTAELILSGMGDSHIEVTLEKIKRKFGVDLETATPRVPYRETISVKRQSEYIHKKQSGGHGQYARVAIEVEPLPRGTGFEFVDKVVGGSVPRQYISSVEKGVTEALPEGILAHAPLTDIRVILYDGKDHPVDSSDMAFKIASSMALKKAAAEANPVLLEPIMNMRITVPEANTGDVISDLNGKRARVLGMVPDGTMTTVEAQAPQTEVQRYAADLRSITQGRGHYSMTFDHYEEVPQHIAQKIIEQAQKAREAARA
ncbi:MAG TPA: elongation factor G [Dehalococcoidia bacterium]|nr:elongation factor G [Dehalococcoidia bacterium]